MKKMVSRLLVLGLAATAWACGSRPEGSDPGREGQLIVSLRADTVRQAVHPAAKGEGTAGAFDPTLLDDYSIDIYKDGQSYKSYPRFADMPLSITLPEGNYELRAAKGENRPSAWESPYYAGANKQIQIREGKPANATVTVSQANARVAVSFNADGFPVLYDSFDAVLSTEYTGPDSLIFAPDETRAGYFMTDAAGTPLNIALRVVLKSSGTAYRIVPQQLPTLKPKQDMRITFNTDDASVTGIGSVTVQVDDEVTEIPVTIFVPGTMLPKPAPEITASGFTSGTVETITEGNTPGMATAVITARGRIKSCRLSMPTNLGLKASYDLAALPAADSAALVAKGLRWTPNLKGKTRGEVNFREIIANLPSAGESASSNTFALTIDDAVPITQTSNTLELKVNVNAPTFGLAMTATDGWARQAMLRGTVTDGNPARLRYEYNNNGTWTPIDLAPAVEGQATTAKWTGLAPTTAYEVRAVYGKHASAPFSFTTEAATGLPNGDMESWYAYMLGKWGAGSNVPFFCPWTNGDGDPWWDTNNARTTAYYGSGFTSGANCFPTTNYTTDKRSGSYAAELRSTGAKYGNTGSICSDASKMPGMLFIGKYAWNDDKGQETITPGHAFTSRPLALTFWYKYMPYNTDEMEAYVEVQNRNGGTTTTIGTGLFRRSLSSAMGAYEQGRADVTYTVETMAATHIVVRFLSSTKGTPDVRKITFDLPYGGTGWGVHVGSILHLDDLSLEY